MLGDDRIVIVEKNHQRASGKTRRRINLAGPLFRIVDAKSDAVKLQSVSKRWSGWLPIDEVVIKDYSGSLTEGNFT